MHVCMILDPDVCMYDAYSLDPDTRDYDAHMYDSFIHVQGVSKKGTFLIFVLFLF